jgi:hypothetical protein
VAFEDLAFEAVVFEGEVFAAEVFAAVVFGLRFLGPRGPTFSMPSRFSGASSLGGLCCAVCKAYERRGSVTDWCRGDGVALIAGSESDVLLFGTGNSSAICH